jgi:hypothetical protein
LAFLKEFKSEDDSHLLKGFGEKVKQVINENVEYEGITKNFRELRLDDIYTMQRLNDMDEKEQALQLEKMLKSEISEHVETNPLFQKFSERLSAIKSQFEQNQMDLSERIKQYKQLREDIMSAHDEAKNAGMELRTYGIYLLTKEYAPDADDKVVKEYAVKLDQILTDHVLDNNWQISSKFDLFVKNIKRTILELTLKDYRDRLTVLDFTKFQNRLTDAIIKTFK